MVVMQERQVCPNCERPLTTDAPLGLCPECLLKSGRATGPISGSATQVPGFEPPSLEQVRNLFPQLEIVEFIGRGGMGAVYKARQPQLERLAALKVLPLRSDHDQTFAARFSREAKALARLNHPNIVSIYDSGQRDGMYYFLMEYVDGVNLRQLERSSRPTPDEALAIIPPICEALEYAHRQGIVHRDVKPENILVDTQRRVKIADFGIAKLLDVPPGDRTLTGCQQVVGTPHYMAPEQVERPGSVDHRADIYSLGVVFYELLTGELPLGKFPPPSQQVRLDSRLDAVVMRALEKEPSRRFQHASEVKTHIEAIATTPSFSDSALPQKAWRRWAILLLLAIVAVAGPLLFWAWHAKSRRPDRPNGQQRLEPGNLGWFLAGNNPREYETVLDRTVLHGGKPSTLLQSKTAGAPGFATLMQTVKAGVFQNQRVRMSGFLRVEGVTNAAGLWMRIDGPLIGETKVAQPLAFDRMEDRPLRGTAEWASCKIVLDVPEAAEEIAFGVSLAGPGKLWLADLIFERVGREVPTTGVQMTREPLAAPKLNFEK
jgi:serine/threonine protein kinase